MLGVLYPVLALVAVASWIVVVTAAIRIAGLAPAGQRWSTWFALGGWRFARVREFAGDASVPYIKRYIQAFLAFFAALIFAVILTFGAAAATRNDPPGQSAAYLPPHTPHSSSLESY